MDSKSSQEPSKSQEKEKSTRVASVAAFTDGGLLLFGLRADSGKWNLPGGHIEVFETPQEAAERELKEEVGLKGTKWLQIGFCDVRPNLRVYSFMCEVDGDPDPTNDPDEEIEAFRWVDPKEIPDSISGKLHNAKDVTLQFLGLQEATLDLIWDEYDGRDARQAIKKLAKMEQLAKKDAFFIERNPWRGEPIKVPKSGTDSRKKYDKSFAQGVADNFSEGSLKRLRPVRVPIDGLTGSNMAVNKSRLQLYSRMLRAGDKLPRVVVKRMGDGFHLLDGNHRLEAAQQAGQTHLDAYEVLDPPIQKSAKLTKGAAGIAAAALLSASPIQAQPPALQAAQEAGLHQWSPDGLSSDLHPIAELESSFGLHMNHAPHSKGQYHTAFGALGFKPVTAHEEYKKSRVMQRDYPNLNDPAVFLKTFQSDPKFYNMLASAHFERLKHRHGSPEAAAYAWRWGTGAASSADADQIANDAYVQKYKHMWLHQRQNAAPLGKMAIRDIAPGKEVEMRDGSKAWSYSHVLPEEYQKNRNYTIRVRPRGHWWDTQLYDVNGNIVGEVNAVNGGDGNNPQDRTKMTMHSILNSKHRGKGLGLAMYEATLAHGIQNGVKTIVGGQHSEAASGVHQALARKHGLSYEAKPIGQENLFHVPEMQFDQHGIVIQTPGSNKKIPIDRGPYQYELKSELQKMDHHDPIDAMLDHDDPKERILALKHFKVTPYHLRRALYDEDPDVRAFAASHPKMSEHLLEEALKHQDVHTRLAAVKRPDLQDKHLEMVLYDPDVQVEVARHPALTEEQRQRMANNTDEVPEGLRQELAKSDLITYPRLGEGEAKTVPVVNNRIGHWRWLKQRGRMGLSGGTHYDPKTGTIASSVNGDHPNVTGAIPHETQHIVFAQLKMKYGKHGARKVIDHTLAALDPDDHRHLNHITGWAIKNNYDHDHIPEEKLAYLHNYLHDSQWREVAHKKMGIHGNRKKEQSSLFDAQRLLQKLKARATSTDAPSLGLMQKSEGQRITDWKQDAQDEHSGDYNIYEDMLGMRPRSDAYLKAVQFLTGKTPDEEQFRRRLAEQESDMESAALNSVGMDDSENNRAALRAVLELQSNPLGKSEIDPKVHEVEAMMPDGTEVADAIRRGFIQDTEKPLDLNGKHSKGALAVRDPQTGDSFLLKPGSGKQSPALGAREEKASQAIREAAFWHVAKLWGISVRFPRADVVFLDGKSVAALHLLPFNWKNLEKLKQKNDGLVPFNVLEKYRSTGELHRWAVIDWVLGNPDRHGQNLMVGPAKDGFPVALIDHGSAFAGDSFCPAKDPSSFIPYYLRAWGVKTWKTLDTEARLRAMPVLARQPDEELKDWIDRLNADELKQLLHRYGINPDPTLRRLKVLKTAVQSSPNASQAINRLWVAA